MRVPGTQDAPPFAFGQQVWLATAHAHARVEKKCPVCFGKRSVVLILGDGERVPVECGYCGDRVDGPRGTVSAYEARSSVTPTTITGLVYRRGEWTIECSAATHSSQVFSTQEEAEARCAILHDEAVAHAARNFESRFDRGKTGVSWTVGYHRKCLKDLKRRVEWHEGKLREAPR